MRERARIWLWQWLIAIDQLAAVGTTFFTFVLFARGPAPNPDETISSRVGRNAAKGKRWALWCERVIDWGALRLAGQRGHCRASIELDEI
jgi:hypothetical protein